MKNGRAKRDRNRALSKDLDFQARLIRNSKILCPNCLKPLGYANGHWTSLGSIPGLGIGALMTSPDSALIATLGYEVAKYNGFYDCEELFDPVTRRRLHPGTCGFINDLPEGYQQR